jgi:serine/threonine-protein kinase
VATQWLTEIRRRKVHRALLAYAALCWLMAQVMQFLADAYAWPAWTLRAAVAVFLLGIPVVVSIAWFFDLTPEGFVAHGAAGDPPDARSRFPAGVAWLAGLLLLGGIYFIARQHAVEPHVAAGTGPVTLAVLPFKPIVAGDRDEALEMGMADTLIFRLSGIADVTISALSSVRGYTNLDQDALAAGRELGVQTVLDGSVQKRGTQLRVTTRLLNVGNGRQIWAAQFNEQYTDIFEVQDSIANRVTSALALTLSAEEQHRLTQRSTNDPVAYDLFLTGRLYWGLRSEPGRLSSAIEAYELAIERDPDFALAYSGLADALAVQAVFGIRPSGEVYPRALAMAQRALDLDPQLAEAHATRGHIRTNYEYDWAGALADFDDAIRLDPRYAMAHVWRAFRDLYVGGGPEAIESLDRATQLEPESLAITILHARGLYWLRRYDAAAAELERVLEVEPRNPLTLALLAAVYTQLHRYDDALRVASSVQAEAPGGPALSAIALAISGRTAEAREELAKLEARVPDEYVSAYDLASIHATLHDLDGAFDWLDAAFEERATLLATLRIDPVMDGLREDPRYSDLEKRMGLPAR